MGFGVKGLPAATAALSNGMSEDKAETHSGGNRDFSVTGKGKGTACDGPTSASTGRPQCLPRPPSFRSPSRCPRPARRSPGKRTSSCSHTCGICPELLPESELPPARRTRTSGAGPRPGRPEKPRPLLVASQHYAGSERPVGPRRTKLMSGSRCAAAASSRVGTMKAGRSPHTRL